MKFITEDFLFKNKTAKKLYHDFAADMPIIDYHCHINPKEIAEDKTDYSYLKGDLVCIYPNGKISEPMNRKELAKELKMSKDAVSKIRDSKSPYKVSDRYHASKEIFKYLKTLEGIRIVYYEDYLKEHKNNLKK